MIRKMEILKINRNKLVILFSFVLLSVTLQSALSQWKAADNPLTSDWTTRVTPENAWQEYPRPQMVREKWLNLNGLWDYAIRPKEDGVPSTYDGKILVPFPVESALSGVKKPVGEKNRLWYRRFITIPENWSEPRIVLRFEAVDWETRVWVNGKYVGDHTGGYDHSAFDISRFLTKEGPQEIVVSVWDPVDSGTQPRGKQVMDPSGIWYTSVTGIWQSVWLEPLPVQNIETFRLVPDIDVDSIGLRVVCVNNDRTLQLEAIVMDSKSVVSRENALAGKPMKMAVPHAKLWTPDSPFLYDLVLVLRDKDGNTVDSVQGYFGMRKISLGQEEDGIRRIMLNNKFVFQFGFLDQGWWPDGLYTAPTDDALRYDIEMTKKMGFNLARKHVKVEPERWYYWCDRLGLLVWQDMPSGDKFIDPGAPDIERSLESGEQFKKELDELMREHYNHPSIIVWVPFNEGWGQWSSIKVSQYIKGEDPTRLVDPASGWTDRNNGDMHDMHMYPGPGMPETESYRAVVLGEFGGLGLPLEGHTWQSKNNWGYRNLKDTADLLNAYSDLVAQLMPLKRKGLSAAVYTQTTDVEGEVNGLMTYDRRITKINPSVLSRLNRGYVAPEIGGESNLFTDSLRVPLYNNSPSGEIHYTTDGKEPVKSSPVYKTAISVKKTTLIKARIYWPDGSFSKVSEMKFEKAKLHKAKKETGLAAGIGYQYFENTGKRWEAIPDWKSLKPLNTGVTEVPGIGLKKREDDYGFVFEGFVNAETDGIYSFYVESDDGSKLIIDGIPVIENDGVHGTIEKKGEIALAKGFHQIRLEYFQGAGGSGLAVRVSGPGIKKQAVPAKMLFRKETK
jgi:hypothetical protein